MTNSSNQKIITVGRSSSCHIVINNQNVSSAHAKFIVTDNTVTLEDSDSTNGTYIPCSSVMFDMDKINEVGYFETNILATDELFWPKILHKYPIAILGEGIMFRRNHPSQAEWSDFNNKPKEIVSAHKHFLKLENYENRIEYKKKIRKLINKKSTKNLLGISASVIRYYRNDKLAFWYIKQALKLDTVLPLKTNLFWKVLLIFILDKLGLFNPLRRIKQYIQTIYR